MAAMRCGETPRSFGRAPPHRATDDRLYFAVRSLGFSGPRHILQYAFADDRGNVVMSTLGRSDAPSGAAPQLGEDLLVEPLDSEALDLLLGRVCDGANMVAFGRVLQAGVLPAPAVQGARSIDCAWRRFLRIARQRSLSFDRCQPLTLDDALATAGLPPLPSADAALRALAIRDLWLWMDRVDLEGVAQ
jgi:hypothetical protein